MTKLSRLSVAFLLAAMMPSAIVRTSAQELDVGGLHSAWRGCLDRNFGLQAVLTSRTSAAESALRSCRGAEGAYLAALATSPLVDGEDVARVRPALIQRAKGWLLQKASATRPL
ncbi:hypothetical protein [Methylobacterium marchantiae]|uniref:Uncharacterized protein n=1 Tax=Methylobacterium marchantiae TaxID=600331 RepID=A0ABW3WUS9_9HYPH|nr:hypothetical protein AIGOOFII_3071 [Methylobacterium marchantiae]